MKHEVLKDLLQNTTLEEMDADVTRAIVHDEFCLRTKSIEEPLSNYRNRAIDRLVEMRVRWYAEGNIEYHVSKRFVQVLCPYCNRMMIFNGISGRMYLCEICGATAFVPVEGTSFTPPTRDFDVPDKAVLEKIPLRLRTAEGALYSTITNAVKSEGAFSRDTIAHFEEVLYTGEYEFIVGWFEWLNENNLTFGSANRYTRAMEYAETL